MTQSKETEGTIDFFTKHYNQLVGYEIVGWDWVEPNDERANPLPSLLLRGKDDGHELRVEVSQDEKGNGGGFLFIRNANTSHPRTQED